MALESTSDPRWDDAGFSASTGYQQNGVHAIAWLKVGYAREVAPLFDYESGSAAEHALSQMCQKFGATR